MVIIQYELLEDIIAIFLSNIISIDSVVDLNHSANKQTHKLSDLQYEYDIRNRIQNNIPIRRSLGLNKVSKESLHVVLDYYFWIVRRFIILQKTTIICTPYMLKASTCQALIRIHFRKPRFQILEIHSNVCCAKDLYIVWFVTRE